MKFDEPFYEDLRGKTVLITGATGGLGQVFCRLFAANGANLCICYHQNRDKALQLKADLEKEFSVKTGIFQLSVEDHQSCQIVIEKAIKQFGRVHVLINNAGIPDLATFLEDKKISHIKLITAVNLTGPMYMCKYILPHMKQKRGGVIINVGSICGQVCFRGSTLYGVVKQALSTLTKSTAKEAGVYRIRVNSLIPGYINTGMISEASSNVLKKTIKETPLRRMGEAIEVARVLVFLASDQSSYITGQQISVNGGAFMP